MIRFKKKLQLLKKEIRSWISNFKRQQVGILQDLKSKLCDIDKQIDQEGDENSKYFHAIINKKRATLSVKGTMVDGDWITDPELVKHEFRKHFEDRFQDPGPRRGSINFPFPNRLFSDQNSDLEAPISNDEIRAAVWGCDVDKSPCPDGFTFEFFRKFWNIIGPDFCLAVLWFFDHGGFAVGCNSSFVTLISKVMEPKIVSDFRPISLIGSLYKVVTKILSSRLSLVISDLISDVQSAFLPNRQILDGPFIINEVLSKCKLRKHQLMIFKVDFAKAYDSVRWDFLDDVLNSFGFGTKWRSWVRVDADIFIGYKIDSSATLSHLFYADDAIFIGDWSSSNLRGIMNILRCFSLLSGDNMSSIKAWDNTVAKMENILSRWKLKTLSIG
nr:hypothetical protein [Tanacetum cinerariifolium]